MRASLRPFSPSRPTRGYSHGAFISAKTIQADGTAEEEEEEEEEEEAEEEECVGILRSRLDTLWPHNDTIMYGKGARPAVEDFILVTEKPKGLTVL